MASGDVATWVGSIGIVLTLAATVWQVGHEARLRRRERYRSHAVGVSAWYRGPMPGSRSDDEPFGDSLLTISNRSDQPIYEVVVTTVFIQGAAPHTGEEWVGHAQHAGYKSMPRGCVFGTVGPGLWTATVKSGDSPMQGRLGCEIAFTDPAGHHWIRRSNGKLESIKKNAIDHYGLTRPLDYAVPESAE